MSDFEMCMTCHEFTLIPVDVGIKRFKFFSCTNDDCKDHADLVMETDLGYIKVCDMINDLKGIHDEITTS